MARKRQQDVTVLHGHHVVTGPELRAAMDSVRNPDGTGSIRRRAVHGMVLVILIGMICAAIILAFAIINGQLKVPAAVAAKETVKTCPTDSFAYAANESINVNVYNSTNRPGLARAVADDLLARKFVVGAVSNIDANYRGVAAIVSGTAGQAAAFSLQRNLQGSDYFLDARTDASVDVVLAQNYSTLTPQDVVDQTPGPLLCPRDSRRVADTGKSPVVPSAAPAG